VIKARSARNLKVAITCASYSPSGEYIAAGCADGSVQLFLMRKSAWLKPDITIRPAHAPDAELTAVNFAPDGRTLASRATDNAVKVWDIRKPQAPLKVVSDVLTYFESANVAFSPDSKLFCCGVNIRKGERECACLFLHEAHPMLITTTPTPPLLCRAVCVCLPICAFQPRAASNSTRWRLRRRSRCCRWGWRPRRA
jgi:hypothetical protein